VLQKEQGVGTRLCDDLGVDLFLKGPRIEIIDGVFADSYDFYVKHSPQCTK
jgi:hypothetical protein